MAMSRGSQFFHMTKTAPFRVRASLGLLSALLFMIFLRLIGFVLDDIDRMQPPLRSDFEAMYVDAELEGELERVKQSLTRVENDLGRQVAIKENRRMSRDSAKQTWDQVERSVQTSTDRGTEISEELLSSRDEAIRLFMEAKTAYEAANDRSSDLEAERFELQSTRDRLDSTLSDQRRKAYPHFEKAYGLFRTKLATYKLAFTVPLTLLSVLLASRKRSSVYRAIPMALAIASCVALGGVMFDHFPREYFKYVAIFTALGVVLLLITRVVKAIHKPRPEILLRTRREAYNKHACPECSYPFPSDHGPSYTCPACGTGLFEGCSSCSGSRHSLLPHCIHCGAAT